MHSTVAASPYTAGTETTGKRSSDEVEVLGGDRLRHGSGNVGMSMP
jgi:hypothetical protein